MRDIAAVARVARLRLEDSESVSGNGVDTAGRYRRLEAKSCDARNRAAHRGLEENESEHIQQ